MFKWIKTSTKQPRLMPLKVTISDAEVQDYLFDFDELTEQVYVDLFQIQEKTEIPYDNDDNRALVVSIEIDPNLHKIIREHLTFFDWVSDIGGLQSLIFSWMAFVVGF